jgi:tRNA(Arg) A34 adenosine deaminase TadA
MCLCSRRVFLATAGASFAVGCADAAPAGPHREFIAAAFKMRDAAVKAGDQAYGAVVVKDGRIIGYGPSRVISKQDWNAHAEREAILDAQARLGRADLSGCLLYSSSRPCAACEAAAAKANIARMYHGSEATDAGAPRGRGGA